VGRQEVPAGRCRGTEPRAQVDDRPLALDGEANHVVTNICLDDYHRLDRAARKQAGVTALNPERSSGTRICLP
jgi:hypothetical protein